MSGLDLARHKQYLEIHQRSYWSRWFGTDEDRRLTALEMHVFEELFEPNLSFVNRLQHELYIPPYREDKLPKHLKEVVLKEKNNSLQQ